MNTTRRHILNLVVRVVQCLVEGLVLVAVAAAAAETVVVPFL